MSSSEVAEKDMALTEEPYSESVQETSTINTTELDKGDMDRMGKEQQFRVSISLSCDSLLQLC